MRHNEHEKYQVVSAVNGETGAMTAAVRERITIRSSTGWGHVNLRELWRYRELMWRFLLRDIQARYKQTVFGVLWAVVQPIFMMLVMTFVFGKGLRLEHSTIPGIPYALSFLAAQIVWSFFANGLTSTAGSVTSNAEIIRKIYFPRLIVPIAGLGTAIVDFLIALIVFAVIVIVVGPPVTATLLLLPLVFLSMLLAAFGVGLLFAGLMVRYRDFRYVVPYCLQIGFFVTPVIWWEESIAGMMGGWSIALYLNPITGPLTTFRNVMFGEPVYWQGWMISSFVALLLTVVAVMFFTRAESHFADIA